MKFPARNYPVDAPGRCRVLVLIGLLWAAGSLTAEVPTVPSTQTDEPLVRWLLLGPIPVTASADPQAAGDRAGFTADPWQDAGGEGQLVPAEGAEQVLGDMTLRWQLHQSQQPLVDLTQPLGAHEHAVAYAAINLEATTATSPLLSLGTDDAVRVWLNGQLVHDFWVQRAAQPEQDLVPLKLQPGTNRLLLKIYNAHGDWGFRCQLLSQQRISERLVDAVERGDQAAVGQLLAGGADLNGPTAHGITAWQMAKVRGYESLATQLAQAGARTDLPGEPHVHLNSLFQLPNADQLPGLAILIARDGQVLYQAGFGQASLEHQVPVTTRTKFRIGSITKQFTAAAILKLQEDGKLQVSDTLAKFLPNFPQADRITLHHLLTHTSGLHNYTDRPDFYTHVAAQISEADMIASFEKDPPDFAPGERFSYCNTGYFLLGHIVSQVSGQPLADYLQTTFFEPLEMRDTGIHDATRILPHEATGYSLLSDGMRKALNWDMSRAGGAGAMYSTVEDLFRWNEALFAGRVLNEASLRAAFTPATVSTQGAAPINYGYGWQIDEVRGLKRISHNGGLTGWLSHLARFPDQKLTVAVLHNALPPVPEFTPDAVGQHAAELFLWREMKSRELPTQVAQVDTGRYADYVGRYAYSPGAVLEVTRQGDRLFAQLTSQPAYEIFPSSEQKFFWKVVDAQVEFLRNAAGVVEAAQHTQGGKTFRAPKLPAEPVVELPADVLDRYVGKYRYSLLGVLTVRRQGTQLFAKMTFQPEFELAAKAENRFYWRFVPAEIEFQIGEDGKVTQAVHRQGGAEITVTKIE